MYNFKIQETNVQWFPPVPEKIEMPILRKRMIYDEFEKTEVFIDNIKDYPNHLFYWNKKLLIPKEKFLQKYTQSDKLLPLQAHKSLKNTILGQTPDTRVD